MFYYYESVSVLKESMSDGTLERDLLYDLEHHYMIYNETCPGYKFLARMELDESFTFSLLDFVIGGVYINNDFINSSGCMYGCNLFGICHDLHNLILRVRDHFIIDSKARGRSYVE